ncbi:HK97 family phage prohead protease [Merdimmobilis hominis]|uniref:HK97 family phage prohead protease n=1 Tax=Merdimmobilis hominis TaxID=2897707 RepID=UPI0009F55A03|nr:HK97 family phage prohead protease [Merdimmobilis hominis]
MEENMELRAFEVQADEAEEGVIEGYAVVYGQMTTIGGMFREVVEPGAVTQESLKDVPFFINHNDRMIPVARYQSGRAVNSLELSLDSKGLRFRTKLDLDNNAEARSLYSGIKRGDITGMSFAFKIDAQRWENMASPMPTRRIQKYKEIRDISSVVRPAYRGAKVEARAEPATAEQVLEEARRKAAQSCDLALLKDKIRMKGKV